METKKLYRSNMDSVFAGVCGGIGEYFKIDPVIIRIVWVAFTLLGGAGILAYIIAWIVIPKRNDGSVPEKKSKGCLYAILILILAIIATSILGPIINFFLSMGAMGAHLVFPPIVAHSLGGGSSMIVWIFMIGAFLVSIAVIALIIYLIKKAADK